MSPEPEALRLANKLAMMSEIDFDGVMRPAAVELRRLHEENEGLRKQVAAFNRLVTAQTEQLSFHRTRADKAEEAIRTLQSERDANAILTAEVSALRTVMIAAAEEIQAHWGAHCDAEGYGPANLMRRLEEGIPAEYGYTAGAFAQLKAEREANHKAMQQAVEAMEDAKGVTGSRQIDAKLSAALASLRERVGG